MFERQIRAMISAMLVGFLVVGAAACGGGPGSSALLGDYEVISVTLNSTGCDGEGEATDSSDLLDDGPDGIHGVIMVDSCSWSYPGLGSDSFLQVVSCSELSDCHEEKCVGTKINIGATHEFRDGNDDDGWMTDGDSTSTFGNDDDLCEGTYYTVSMRQDEDGTLVLEKRSYDVEPFEETPSEFGDFLACDKEEAAKAAKPDCTQLEVVRAKPVGADATE